VKCFEACVVPRNIQRKSILGLDENAPQPVLRLVGGELETYRYKIDHMFGRQFMPPIVCEGKDTFRVLPQNREKLFETRLPLDFDM